MPALPFAAAQQSNFTSGFLKSLKSNLVGYANSFRGGYLGHTIITYSSEDRVSALILKGNKVVGYQTGLEVLTDAPTPKASTGTELSLDPDNNVAGRLLRPYGIGQPARVISISDSMDQFLWLFGRLERPLTADALQKRLRINPGNEFGQQWTHGSKPFSWQPFDLNLQPGGDQPSTTFIVAGLPMETVNFYEGWSDTARQELQSLYPSMVATLTFLKGTVIKQSQPCFLVMLHQNSAIMAFWNGAEFSHLLTDLDKSQIADKAVEVAHEVNLQPTEHHTYIYVYARTDAELSEDELSSDMVQPHIDGVQAVPLNSANMRTLFGAVGSEKIEGGFEDAPQPECWLMQWFGKTLR